MPAVTALPGLRDKGQLQPGHKVLIHGASGTSGGICARTYGFEHPTPSKRGQN
jgi:NADPH-dependent curcumin reductase CurA